MKKNKLQKNNSILEEKIKEQTGWNRARIFIIVGLVVSIIKLERVNLKKIAKVLNPNQIKEVNYRRLNRFFQKFRFNMSIFLYRLEYLFLVPKLEFGNLLKKREQDVL